MLEILLVIGLCKSLGSMLRAKGRNPTWMQVMLVACWILGEVGGALVAAVVHFIRNGEDAPVGMGVYLFAILGAACGAGVTFLLAYLLPSVNNDPYAQPSDDYDDVPTGRRLDPDNPYAS